MNDAGFERGAERIADLDGVLQAQIQGQRTLQRPPLDVLENEVVRADVVQRADVRVVLSGDGLGFACEAFTEAVV